MSTLLEHISRTEIVVDVDLDKEPGCESDFHTSPGPYDRHAGAATHWQTGLCPHANGLRCAPHVKNTTNRGGAYCPKCDLFMDLTQIHFIEL